MSQWLDQAELIAAHLRQAVSWCSEAAPEFGRIPVIVDRKLDIINIVNQAAAKANGAAIVVTWTGAKNPDPDSKLLRTGSEYSVACMTRPLTQDAVVTCDDLTEAAALALHDFTPPDTPRHRRLRVTDIALVPNKKMLIYEITADILRI